MKYGLLLAGALCAAVACGSLAVATPSPLDHQAASISGVISNVPAMSPHSAVPRRQFAQVATCHAANNFGAWFYGPTPNAAVYECQINTPVGGVCQFEGCY